MNVYEVVFGDENVTDFALDEKMNRRICYYQNHITSNEVEKFFHYIFDDLYILINKNQVKRIIVILSLSNIKREEKNEEDKISHLTRLTEKLSASFDGAITFISSVELPSPRKNFLTIKLPLDKFSKHLSVLDI